MGCGPKATAGTAAACFPDTTSYWLNDPASRQEEQQPFRLLKQSKAFPFHEAYGGECPGVYYIRLQRDGWKLIPPSEENADLPPDAVLFEKPLPKGWTLQKFAHATIGKTEGRGCYYDTHRLIHPERGLVHEAPQWEWADWDRNRLVWVEAGVLYKSQLTSKGPSFPRPLYDFNPMAFEAIAAPY